MLKKPKILVVGSFMMDLIACTERAPNAGETVMGYRFQTAPGGKGANQAVQCARLGADVTMVGKVGSDAFGQAMLQAVAASGVDVSHVSVSPDEASGVGHITLETGRQGVQNRITVCPGANLSITVEEISWLKTEIGKFDMVLMQFELPMAVIEAVAQWAYDAGVMVMVNPAPAAPMSDALLRCTTYLSPNEHEAAFMTGHAIDVSHGICFDDVKIVADRFRARGVKNLLITMGENGSLWVGDSGITHVECVKVLAVDPTAAGDSFVAAFCTALTAGISEKDALVFASHTAAITVSRMGAMPSLPTLSEVQALIQDRRPDWGPTRAGAHK